MTKPLKNPFSFIHEKSFYGSLIIFPLPINNNHHDIVIIVSYFNKPTEFNNQQDPIYHSDKKNKQSSKMNVKAETQPINKWRLRQSYHWIIAVVGWRRPATSVCPSVRGSPPHTARDRL